MPETRTTIGSDKDFLKYVESGGAFIGHPGVEWEFVTHLGTVNNINDLTP